MLAELKFAFDSIVEFRRDSNQLVGVDVRDKLPEFIVDRLLPFGIRKLAC